MKEKLTYSDASKRTETEIKIYFRIPFTMYWLGRVNTGCRHEWSKLYLFTKEFGICHGESGSWSSDYYWKRV